MDYVCYLWRSEMCAVAFPEMKNRKIMGYSREPNLCDIGWPDKTVVRISNYSTIIKNIKNGNNEDMSSLISHINDINIKN